jgi:hypothetical protein
MLSEPMLIRWFGEIPFAPEPGTGQVVVNSTSGSRV